MRIFLSSPHLPLFPSPHGRGEEGWSAGPGSWGEVAFRKYVLEHLHPVPAVFLGAVERFVGLLDKHVELFGVLQVHRDTEAHRHADVLALRTFEEAALDLLADALDGLHRLLRVGLDKHKGELLAAVARDDVDAVAQVFPEPRRHILENRVAEGMPVRVVDFFKKVDVAQHERQRIAVAYCAGDFVLEERLELAVVDEAREPVVGGKVMREFENVDFFKRESGRCRQAQKQVAALGILLREMRVVIGGH